MRIALTVSLPRFPQYAATARLIAVQSAQDCGCARGAAEAFAGSVEDAVKASLAGTAARPHVVMAVERTANTLVVTVDSQVMQLTL